MNGYVIVVLVYYKYTNYVIVCIYDFRYACMNIKQDEEINC